MMNLPARLIGCVCLFLAFATHATLAGDQLETVSDDDLVQMIKNDEFLVVLFSKKNCENCDRFEEQLVNLRVDLKESLDADVVKAHSSQLSKLYSPTKEPAVVFFRHGVPLLYEGAINEDAIFQLFEANRAPVVKELSDANFEHLTQAATGSTTGDWFVQFYTQNCVDCQRLSAVWETVGATLKNRMNVARINKDSVGTGTAKRFKIAKAPEFVLIRKGKFYRYEAPVYDVKAFVSFATDFYRNSKAEAIQVPPSPFDELVQSSVRHIQTLSDYAFALHAEQPDLVYGGLIGTVAAFLVLAAVIKCRSSGKQVTKQTKKAK